MKPGDKVVCISDEWILDPAKYVVVGEQPKEGDVFVIRDSRDLPDGNYSLKLIGVEIYLGLTETGWGSEAFRLLSEMKNAAR